MTNSVDRMLLAQAIGDGDAGRMNCPQCYDGVVGRGTVSVWRDAGQILGHCKRASCGWVGKTLFLGEQTAQAAPPALTPYTGETFEDERSTAAFERHFGFPIPSGTRFDREGYMIIPIRDSQGSVRGHIRRYPHWWSKNGLVGPKTKTYKATNSPQIGWAGVRSGPVILVEDPISAHKLAWFTTWRAVFLNGVGLNAAIVAELQRRTDKIIVALDPDATTTAFELVRTWSPAFTSMRVIILEKDVKDMTKEEILATFGFDA